MNKKRPPIILNMYLPGESCISKMRPLFVEFDLETHERLVKWEFNDRQPCYGINTHTEKPLHLNNIVVNSFRVDDIEQLVNRPVPAIIIGTIGSRHIPPGKLFEMIIQRQCNLCDGTGDGLSNTGEEIIQCPMCNTEKIVCIIGGWFPEYPK